MSRYADDYLIDRDRKFLINKLISSTGEVVGDINECDENGDTKLIRACREFGADYQIGHLPIVQLQHLKYVEQLLEQGANLDIKNLQGRNALMELFGRVNSLIYHYADERMQDAKRERKIVGEQVRTYTIEREQVTFKEEDVPEKIVRDEGSSISVWTRFKEEDEKEFMDEAKESLREQKKSNASKVIKALLKAGVDIDELDREGKSALVIAHDRRDEEMVDVLLQAGANEFELKILDPEYKYLNDQQDRRNIHDDRSEWYQFVSSITEGVQNKDLNKYPRALSNLADNSVSFFVSTETYEKSRSYYPDHNHSFISSIEAGYFVEQLKFQSRQLGFKKLSGKDFLEIKPGELGDVIEYKFNISAENLDSILQLNPIYSGYRNEGSILKLVKDFSLKPGSIMLWPLQSLDEDGKVFHVMAAGCQTTELPTLQLMKLLPNYESEILPRHKESGFSFHWTPKEVEDGLLMGRGSVIKVLKKIFLDNGIKVTEGNSQSFAENPEILQIEDRDKMHGIRIVPMDENSQDFYALYGNIAKEELSHCVSLEVKVETFLEAIEGYLNELEPDDHSNNPERIANARATINLMIEQERERHPSSSVESAAVSAANSRGCCVIS
ncbi:MAG: hypothetical protein V4694_01335 [Pseudomonadota bacterium]